MTEIPMKGPLQLVKTALLALVAGGMLAVNVSAADIKDGRAIVSPAQDDRFMIDNFTFGKAELFGYVSDLKDTKKITGLVLRAKKGKDVASDEQKRAIGSIANTLQIESFLQEGKELVPIVHQPQ